MSSAWEGLIDGARDLDRGAGVEAVLTDLLTSFDACGTSDPGYAVAEFLRALLAAWSDDEDDLWMLGEADDEA